MLSGKVTIQRLVKSAVFTNKFSRNITVKRVWQFYHNEVQSVRISTTENILSLFFYFLTGFLRKAFRAFCHFDLNRFFVNSRTLSLYVGQTHFLNADKTYILDVIMGGFGVRSGQFFTDPLLYVRLGRYYIDRITLYSFVDDCREVVVNQNLMLLQLEKYYGEVHNLFESLQLSLCNYYNSLTSISNANI